MRKNQIEKLLRSEADNIPNPLNKIKAAAMAENLLPESKQTGEIRQGNTAIKFKYDKKLLSLAAAGVAVATAIALTLTFTLGDKNPIPNNVFIGNGNNPSSTLTHVTLSTEKSYGIGAVSTVKLLESSMPAASVKSLMAASATAKNDEDEVKNQIDKFNEYFSALDSFLGDDIVSANTEVNRDASYPYDFKMVIAGKDFSGTSVSYVMYYTETQTSAIYSAVDYDHDEDDDKTVASFTLTGVMIVNGNNYVLEGQRIEESESDEIEAKLQIRAFADTADRSSFVQMEQKTERESDENQTKYVYSVYSKNNLIEQTAVEFETQNENGKSQTEYKIEFRNGSGKGRYAVKREIVASVAQIKVKYEVDGKTGEFCIRETTDANGVKQYEYKFSDGYNKSYPKHGNDEHSNDKFDDKHKSSF